MAKLENIRLAKHCKGEYQIILDWDNTRSQAIQLERLDPNEVIDALTQTIHVLRREQKYKRI